MTRSVHRQQSDVQLVLLSRVLVGNFAARGGVTEAMKSERFTNFLKDLLPSGRVFEGTFGDVYLPHSLFMPHDSPQLGIAFS